jgi:ATP-dependent Lon protease
MIYEIKSLAFGEKSSLCIPIQGKAICGGSGNVIVTGNLDTTSKEVVDVAFSILNLTKNKLHGKDYHLHFLYSDHRKIGGSCGLPVYLMLAWLVGKLPYHEGIAATGELDLQGNIMPVKFISSKIIAWAKSKSQCLILPGHYITSEEKNLAFNDEKRLFFVDNVNDLKKSWKKII